MTRRITFNHAASAIVLALSSSAFVTGAAAQGAEGSGMSTSSQPGMSKGKAGGTATADTGFAMQAAKGGMAEVALGQMAKEKASSDAVKQFASHMVDDHTKANDELKQLADGKGIKLPASAAPDATSKKLSGLSGAAFDKQYMTAMLADHKKTIALFEKESKSGRDDDMKAFATKTLPTLNDHLQMVQATQATLGR